MSSASDDVSPLLFRLAGGDASAMSQLMPLVEKELRRIAASYMRRERPDHTLQSTALVNEAFLRLVKQPKIRLEEPVAFLRYSLPAHAGNPD